MSQNKFEVFLGTYNAAPWIESVIHSLESQDCDPFVVRIIDNASEDNTVSIIQNIFASYSFKNTYDLVKNYKNIGAISSFLDRLDLFDSEWIVMIHQDDVYHENHLSTLHESIEKAKSEVGLIFTAMQRLDANNIEKLSPPTISSKLSKSDRFENFLLSLQITPFNFPASALRKSALKTLETTRHTTAFNDTELLLRMICNFDVEYIPIETMHYRIFEGNAASQTKQDSNDRAIFIGLNELLHSRDFDQILNLADSENNVKRLLTAINSAINIRIANSDLKLIAKNVAAETLIRKLGYLNSSIRNNLVENLISMNMKNESNLATNQEFSHEYSEIPLTKLEKSPYFKDSYADLKSVNVAGNKLINKIPLQVREKFFNLIFSSPVMARVKRPFVKTWRFRNKVE